MVKGGKICAFSTNAAQVKEGCRECNWWHNNEFIKVGEQRIHLFVVYILQKTNICYIAKSLKTLLCAGRSSCWTLGTSRQILMTLIKPLPLPLRVEIVSVVIVDVIIIIIVIFVIIIKGKGKGSTATLRHRKLSGHSAPSGHCFTELATVLLFHWACHCFTVLLSLPLFC